MTCLGSVVPNFKTNCIQESHQFSNEIVRSSCKKSFRTIKQIPYGQKRQPYSEGAIFYDHFYQNKQNWSGKLINREGDIYIGEWTDGILNGYCTITFKDGSYYQGNVINGKRSGNGLSISCMGETYKGEWQDDKMHGGGEYTFEDKTFYVGQLKQNKFEGKGIMYYSNGERYVGDFMNGLQNEVGTFYFINGKKYKGQFKDGQFHGHGAIIIYKFLETSKEQKIKRVIEGIFSMSDITNGEIKFSNGDVYIGQIKNLLMRGSGRLVTKKGVEFIGKFIEDDTSFEKVEYIFAPLSFKTIEPKVAKHNYNFQDLSVVVTTDSSPSQSKRSSLFSKSPSINSTLETECSIIIVE